MARPYSANDPIERDALTVPSDVAHHVGPVRITDSPFLNLNGLKAQLITDLPAPARSWSSTAEALVWKTSVLRVPVFAFPFPGLKSSP